MTDTDDALDIHEIPDLSRSRVFRMSPPFMSFLDMLARPAPASVVPQSGVRVSVPKDACPVTQSLRSACPSPFALHTSSYSLSQSTLDSFDLLTRSGRASSRKHVLDFDQLCEDFDERELRVWLERSRASVLVRKNHLKHFVALGSGGDCATVLSSSNGGHENGSVEWNLGCTDTRLADFLTGDGPGDDHAPAIQRKLPGKLRQHAIVEAAVALASELLPFPLAPVSVLQAAQGTSSFAVLAHLVLSMPGPVDLRIASWSTSKGFVDALAALREVGHVGGLRWSLDKGMRTRKGNSESGDVMSALKAKLGGCYSVLPFDGPHLHGKWATLRGSDGSRVSVLSTANWQLTNPRAEGYVVLIDPSVAEFLDGVQDRLEAGNRGNTARRRSPIDDLLAY